MWPPSSQEWESVGSWVQWDAACVLLEVYPNWNIADNYFNKWVNTSKSLFQMFATIYTQHRSVFPVFQGGILGGEREFIHINSYSCTKSFLKYPHHQNKVLEFSVFQPVPLFWPEVSLGFTSFCIPCLYTYTEKLRAFSLSFHTTWQCQPTGTSLRNGQLL